MVPIRKIACPPDKIALKCPNAMTPRRIVIHNTANDASADAEIRYMHSNELETSFHFAVDDREIVQGLELDRNGWHAGDGNGPGNSSGIGIEICYSESGGDRFRKAQQNAAELTAYLLLQYGFDISAVTKHEDYSGKHCPERTLDEYGWDYFLGLVKNALGTAGKTAPKTGKISVVYQTWDDVQNRWHLTVTDSDDYAGVFGHDVCAVYARLTGGNIYYAVHTKGGRWLPEVKNREDYAGLMNRPIDGLMMRTDTGKKIRYAVHLRRSDRWLPYVSGCSASDPVNGYAGILGQEIDAVRIYLEQ